MRTSSRSPAGLAIGLGLIVSLIVLAVFMIQKAVHKESPFEPQASSATSFTDIDLYLAEHRVQDTASIIQRANTDSASQSDIQTLADDLVMVKPQTKATLLAVCSKLPFTSGIKGYCSVANQAAQ